MVFQLPSQTTHNTLPFYVPGKMVVSAAKIVCWCYCHKTGAISFGICKINGAIYFLKTKRATKLLMRHVCLFNLSNSGFTGELFWQWQTS
jgi:hypothetical protein